MKYRQVKLTQENKTLVTFIDDNAAKVGNLIEVKNNDKTSSFWKVTEAYSSILGSEEMINTRTAYRH